MDDHGAAGSGPEDDAVDGELDLEGRRALGAVLRRLTGRRETVSVGRYELGEKLGVGGCGAVYAAWDPKLDRRVAVKVVLPTRASIHDDTTSEARLLREAQALAKLRHPNVVEVFDVGVDDVGADARGRRRRGVYIVMELVEGPTLRDWLRDTRPERTRILEVYAQAAEGLAAAHRAGIVHRDFKPANVMLTERGRVKVLDFGLAREDLEPFPDTSPTGRLAPVPRAEESLTRTGVVMGTPRYMAPEQHAAEAATPESDQYALAVCLWEALLDAPPFHAETIELLCEAKHGGPPPRPAALPRRLYDVLCRAMDPRPDRRYPDVTAFATRLLAPQRRQRWSIALGAALVASAAGLGLAVTESRPGLPACDSRSPVEGWRGLGSSAPAAVQAVEGDDPSGVVGRLRARVDRFVTEWTEARAGLCGTQGETLPPQERRDRMACLQRAATRFDAVLADLTERPDSRGARHRVMSLESPSRCVSEPPDTIFRRTPEEDEELDALADMATDLIEMKLAWDEPTAQAFEAGIDRAKALGDTWTTVQMLSAQAVAMAQRGESGDAVRLALEASWIAEASGDLLLASEMVPAALSQLYDHAAPRAEFERVVAHGEELLHATGDPAVPRIGLESMRSMFLERFGDFEAATAAAEAALARAGDPPIPGAGRWVGVALMTMAHHQIDREAFDAAWQTTERMLALRPTDAPWARALAGPAHAFRATVARERGDEDTAIVEALAQIEALSTVLAAEHPATMVGIAFYASLLVDRGATEEGLMLLTAARNRLLDERGGATHQLARVEHFLLDAEIGHGDPTRAIAYAREVIERDAQERGEDSPDLAWAWLAMAQARFAAGDARGAAEALEESLARVPESDTGARLDAIYLRAELHLEAARFAEAKDDYLEVIASLGVHGGGTWIHGFRGEAWRGVATALHAMGEDEAARGVARIADEALALGSYWNRRDREELASLLLAP